MRISYLIVPVIQYNSNLVGSGLVYMMITVSILGKQLFGCYLWMKAM